jgi:hypothetical protein
LFVGTEDEHRREGGPEELRTHPGPQR